MPLAGEMTVEVSYGEQGGCLPSYVVEGNGPSLMGRDWLWQIRLDWKTIGVASMVGCQDRVEALLDQYPEVFKEGLGKMSTFEATPTEVFIATPGFPLGLPPHRPSSNRPWIPSYKGCQRSCAI